MPQVLPLDDAWRDAIDAVLGARGWPRLRDVSRLGSLVARLSEAYNVAGTAARDLLPARLAFSFARDVTKGAAAVRELVDAGHLAIHAGRPVRFLDLGAGLGATTWGVLRALEAAGQRGAIEATWVDHDAAALGVAEELARVRGAENGPIAMRVRTLPGGLSVPRGEPWDLVLLGQVLSELDGSMSVAGRLDKHAALVRDLVAKAVRPDGSLVVLEPALRDRTRHLHAVRDAVLLRGEGITVFAPCLHGGPCPALASEGEWCHEDLPVDLPAWLVPIARASGLRWQGLTFSYLVLRRDGETLAGRGFRWRVVSEPMVTKGKRELFLCGGGPEAPTRFRVQRLDRHATEANQEWDTLSRGDRIRIRPPPEPGRGAGKLGPEAVVDVDRAKE
jgi:SAM-dependent methyltransferase